MKRYIRPIISVVRVDSEGLLVASPDVNNMQGNRQHLSNGLDLGWDENE